MAEIRPPLDSAPAEPIAVIGIGCRFPGDAHDPDSFWRNLLAGVDAVGDVPPDRWSIPRLFDERPGIPGKSSARWGGFLRRIDEFEPEAFGISPREAHHVDPQQRLLLETTWEALEDGGQPVADLAGTRTGVFVGVSTTDYANLQSAIHDLRDIGAHTGTGGATSIVANRISYCFDLKGPSLAVDTACSSSLVAVHLACRSLWAGESTLALAGGVNVIISPSHFVAFSAATMLSPEGHCKAFADGADGFVRSEGAGMVLLKPLARAVADGDRIYAVVLATGVNQDGRTSGISLPNQASQEDLVRETCRRAGVPPSRIQYVEAHGTGTAVGDPIEANAIGNVLAAGREPADACVLGSVKSVIGHLEAAAGIAGFIKTVLAVQHRRIPPNLHFTCPNPLIAFDDLRLRVPVSPEPWPREDAPLLAGVNSFGFGGTNAHVILRDFPQAPAQTREDDAASSKTPAQARKHDGAESRPHLIPLSARTPEALHDLAEAWRDALAPGGSLGETPLSDLGYTARTRRSRHEHALSVTVRDHDELRERLDAFLAGERRPGMFVGKRGSEAPPVVFAFCGQGAQWLGMGRELIEHEPVFRDTIRTCDRLLAEVADWSLWSELTADEGASRLDHTAVAQPAIFGVQVALAALWKSWGITPVGGDRPQRRRDRRGACSGAPHAAGSNAHRVSSWPHDGPPFVQGRDDGGGPPSRGGTRRHRRVRGQRVRGGLEQPAFGHPLRQTGGACGRRPTAHGARRVHPHASGRLRLPQPAARPRARRFDRLARTDPDTSRRRSHVLRRDRRAPATGRTHGRVLVARPARAGPLRRSDRSRSR